MSMCISECAAQLQQIGELEGQVSQLQVRPRIAIVITVCAPHWTHGYAYPNAAPQAMLRSGDAGQRQVWRMAICIPVLRSFAYPISRRRARGLSSWSGS